MESFDKIKVSHILVYRPRGCTCGKEPEAVGSASFPKNEHKVFS